MICEEVEQEERIKEERKGTERDGTGRELLKSSVPVLVNISNRGK